MYWLLSGFAAVISRLSSGAINALAWGLAYLVFDVVRIRRSLVLKNLARRLPCDERGGARPHQAAFRLQLHADGSSSFSAATAPTSSGRSK